MSTPVTATDPRVPIDWVRPLRYAVRLPFVLLHLFVGLPITLLIVLLPTADISLRSGEQLGHRAIRWWSGTLMRIFGLRLRRTGEPLPGAVLFVANHITWADIELLHSQRMMCFVAKSEIGRWPLIGWLAKQAGTIYHRRGSTESLSAVSQVMVERLKQGLAVGVFPEGGTGPGDHVRTFHARIFQAAVDAGVPAQPVALRFLRRGVLTTKIAFRPGEGFFPNFFRVLGEPATTAEIMFLEPVPLSTEGRRRMAETARSRIIEALGFVDRKRGNGVAATPAEPATDDLDAPGDGDGSD